ncbi:unnamed protein product [Rotaria sp. Silwood1]|nr:unnamed protein product [Rotaria sp. Silwood1]
MYAGAPAGVAELLSQPKAREILLPNVPLGPMFRQLLKTAPGPSVFRPAEPNRTELDLEKLGSIRPLVVIKSQKIRQALLKEQDPDLETTEKIIQLAELLEENVRHFGNSINPADYTVAKLHNHQPKRHKQQQSNSFVKNEYKPCETCDSTKHFRSKCKYPEFTCNFCKKTGHLEKVCRQKKNEKNSTKHISTIYQLDCPNYMKRPIKHSSPFSLKVNSYDFTFELDTGTFNTIISMEDWYKLGSLTICLSNLKLKCYSGNALKIKGECSVKV